MNWLLDKIKTYIPISFEIRNVIAIIILVICIIWTLIYANYFNVFVIIKNFVNQYKKCEKGSLGVSIVVPALLALVASLIEKEENFQNMLNGITLIITVLTALFFTIIGLVIELKVKIAESEKNATEKKRLNYLCKFIFQADMFEILICIMLLLLCFIYILGVCEAKIIRYFIYFLSFVVLINIMILLRRLYTVINELMQ